MALTLQYACTYVESLGIQWLVYADLLAEPGKNKFLLWRTTERENAA